jgi:hypothetical protein
MNTVVKIRRVKLDSGGYDPFGRYFGVGYPLFSVDIDNGIDERREYIRATSYQEARNRHKGPGVTVYR